MLPLPRRSAPTCATSGRGTRSTRRGSSNRCAPCTPSAVDAEKKWRRTQNKRYPNGRRFLSTRGRGWPGPIRGGRPMRHALRTAVLALAVLTLGTAPARAVDQAKIDKAIERGVAALKELQGRD